MNPHVRADVHRWEQYFDADRSVRYHRKRQGFFENLHIGLQVLSAVAGTAAFITFKDAIAGDSARWLALALAVFSTLSLVLRPAERARKHADLADKFTELLKELTVPKALTESELHTIISKRLEFEKAEPKHSRALNAVCYDETALALGVPAQHSSKFQRIFAHLLP